MPLQEVRKFIENKLKNDLLYVCTLFEYIGRDTKNHRRDVAAAIGVKQIARLLQYADINHCLDMQQVADEIIADSGLVTGSFDSVSECKYKVPSVTSIGKVYQRLVADVKGEEDWAQTIYNVFDSFLSDEISNFNGSIFYSNPEYLKYSYHEKVLLS